MKGPAEKGFHPLDYIIFILVLAVSLAIGLYHAFTGGKQKTTSEYFMADRKLKTVPVALSILVSFVSAILVLGTPAEMYTRGTQLTMRVIGYCFACVLSSLLFVPLFYSLKVTSSFEFLERRFKSRGVKLMGSVMMLIGNVFYMGLLMYTPSTALEAVTNFPFWMSILATGAVSTLYTTLGGMKAVIWTDVFQSFVMIGGMLIIVFAGTFHIGGLSQMYNLSKEGGRLEFFKSLLYDFILLHWPIISFNPDPTQRLSIWSLVIGGMFSTLTIFGVGQASIQRYCALPTLQQAKRSVYLNIPGLILVNVLASAVGLVVYAYYAQVGCDPLKSGYISNANQIVPYFVIDVLNYPGFPGIFIAVLFSGALSSMSSSLNSAAAVTWEDMIKPFCEHVRESRKILITKCIVLLYGAMAVMVAFLTDNIGMHVLQASLSFTGATMGPSLGMFILGAFFKSANAIGAVSGCVVSLVFTLWLAIGTFIHKPYRRTTLPTSVQNCGVHSDNLTQVNDIIHHISQNNATYLSSSMSSPQDIVLDSSYINSGYGSSDMTSSRYSNITIDGEETVFKLSGVDRFYGLSFLWYSAFGCAICITVGMIVSLLTKSICKNDYDPDLIVPLYERLCCCIPEKLWVKCRPHHASKKVVFHAEEGGAGGGEKTASCHTKLNQESNARECSTTCDSDMAELPLHTNNNSTNNKNSTNSRSNHNRFSKL